MKFDPYFSKKSLDRLNLGSIAHALSLLRIAQRSYMDAPGFRFAIDDPRGTAASAVHGALSVTLRRITQHVRGKAARKEAAETIRSARKRARETALALRMVGVA